MLGIFLDDERFPADVTWVKYPDGIKWTIVRTWYDFVFELSELTGEFCVSFDHDIQSYDETGKEFTGYDCIKHLIDVCIDSEKAIPVCYFHTQNPIGLKNMVSYYENAKKHFEKK